MRILIGHNHYQQCGGEDAVFRSEAKMLAEHGETVEVYERSNSEITHNLFSRVSFSVSSFWSRRSYREVRAIIKRFCPDIAHFHNIFYMMTPSVYAACREEGVPVVQSLHNYRIFCLNGLLFRDGHPCEDCLRMSLSEGVKRRCFYQSWLKSAVLAHSLERYRRQRIWTRHINRFIAATEFTKRKYIEAGLPGAMISVKPHFVEDPGAQGLHADRRHALFMGRLSPEKGIDVLLEAWKDIRDLPLCIFGRGPLETNIQQYIKTYRMDHVRLVTDVDPALYPKLMRTARFVVVPSLCYENFPRVVVEAFAYGVPVLASRRGSLPEVVVEGWTGALFEAGNSEDLARKAVFLGQHPEMGQGARKEYEEKYSVQANAQFLSEIYQQAMISRER